ncbi:MULTISPECIES: hypothetical protein [Paenibacillus]|uniref:Uncharacterized protein n=1 Tax=Paenibacillus albilobatus TaxID=2716884 RepID=A0A919XFR0_9BACL|nr:MULTISPECIES: hypothetical protein [Paenibacillus]GIO29977.1 hypothetical protein J2TS6_11180 [Paenibacillus albilobatus]
MKGNLRFNLVFGVFGFVLTLLFSLTNNLFMTSVIRGLVSFAIWFALAFLLRWAWTVVSTPPAEAELHDGQRGDQETGTRLDLTTPDESDELNELLKPKSDLPLEKDAGFTPLNPPKLVSKKDPEELAKAVRHLTEN